jgi:hypothetical protein
MWEKSKCHVILEIMLLMLYSDDVTHIRDNEWKNVVRQYTPRV